MSAGIKANNDGSAAIQVGGSDYITISSAGAVAIPQTLAVTGTATFSSTTTFTGAATLTGGVAGDFKMNSGYGSVATAYGCRAWVNFNGTANTNLSGTYTQNNGGAGSGTVITITATAHGLIAGNSVYLDFTTGTSVDGVYTVTSVTSANVFVCTGATNLNTSGNVTLIRSTIRASGNVSSVADNGTGDYTVNFAVAMPDANYSVQTSGGSGSGIHISTPFTGTPSTTSFRMATTTTGGTGTDLAYVTAAVFR